MKGGDKMEGWYDVLKQRVDEVIGHVIEVTASAGECADDEAEEQE